MYPKPTLKGRVEASLKVLGLRPVCPEEGAAHLNRSNLSDPPGNAWPPTSKGTTSGRMLCPTCRTLSSWSLIANGTGVPSCAPLSVAPTRPRTRSDWHHLLDEPSTCRVARSAQGEAYARVRIDMIDRSIDAEQRSRLPPRRWVMTKSTSRSEQSVPQLQFELRCMLEEATGAKLTSIEDCSKALLAGPCVVYAWIASKPG